MTITEIFYELLNTPEDEYHDFKQQWYDPHHKDELVKDIFSFVNTLHHKDCYLIIGVDDNHNIVGVENDPHRLNNQKLTTIIHSLPIANSHKPKVIVSTISTDNYKIDIITIKDTDDVPVYLDENKHWPHVKHTINAGQIFSRVNENNTAMNETASDWAVEQLWKKRFGLDISIQERYIAKLKDVDHWEYLEADNKSGFLYDIDPDYYMYLKDDDVPRYQAESYSLGLFCTKMYWHVLVLTFRNRVIKEFPVVYLDNVKFLSMSPDPGYINHYDTGLPFQYFLSNSLEFAVENFLYRLHQPGVSPDKASFHNILNHIVIFKDGAEREAITNELKERLDDISNQCTPSPNQLKQAKGHLSQKFTDQDPEMAPSHIESMCLEANVSQYIKQYLTQKDEEE